MASETSLGSYLVLFWKFLGRMNFILVGQKFSEKFCPSFSEIFCPWTKNFIPWDKNFLKIFILGLFFSRTKIPVTGVHFSWTVNSAAKKYAASDYPSGLATILLTYFAKVITACPVSFISVCINLSISYNNMHNFID